MIKLSSYTLENLIGKETNYCIHIHWPTQNENK